MPGKKIHKKGRSLLIAAITALAVAIFFIARGAHGAKDKAEMILFYLPSCPHCHDAMAFLDKIASDYPDLKISRYDANTRSGNNYYAHYKKKLKFEQEGVPLAVFGDKYEMGFESEATTGAKYVSHIREMLNAVGTGEK
ncbi:MAG: hypothetical protein LBO78_02580 [Rickettsiales bacterium]|nr:hypothetical protein [Rickettsiales bacterium]